MRPYIIRGSWLQAGLVYHQTRGEYGCEYLDADGNRYLDFPGHDVVVRWEIRTRCGLLVDWWTRERERERGYVWVDPSFASTVARPCRKCFPKELAT